MVDTTAAIRRHHHITLCVGTAQEDYDFHTKVLGLKSVKKTALYDGDVPIYHLYYGNDQGAESTLVTSFPMRQSGRVGRRGTNQTRVLMLSIPETSIGYWRTRLADHGFTVEESEVSARSDSASPTPAVSSMRSLASLPMDAQLTPPVPCRRSSVSTAPTGSPYRYAISDLSAEFMTTGWSGHLTQEEGARARFEVGDGGSGCIVDFVAEPQLDQAGWMYGEGIVHHTAFQVADYDTQTNVKSHLEGLGFTDVSERKDRGYFESIYVRIPSGALFEATVSKPEGFLIDEPYESLGKTFQVPPVFAGQREFLMSYLEPLEY